jgi:hypothetical protein
MIFLSFSLEEVPMNKRLVLNSALIIMLTGVPLMAQSYEEILSSARALLRQQRYTEAAAEGRKAIALDKTRWEGYFVAGTAYAGNNACDAAIPYLGSASERNPPAEIKAAIDKATAECERPQTGEKAAVPNPTAVVNSTAGTTQPHERKKGRGGLYIPEEGQPIAVFCQHGGNDVAGILTVGPTTVTYVETGDTTDRKLRPNPSHNMSLPRDKVRAHHFERKTDCLDIRFDGKRLDFCNNDTDLSLLERLLPDR